MLRFQRNKLFCFIGLLLLICLSAAAFHFLAHHDNSADTDHCAICQFITTIAVILFCVFLFFFKSQQTRFDFLEFKKILPAQYLSAVSGRAPPLILS